MATPKKKHLIELMIEAGVKWPDGAEYAAQDKRNNKVFFFDKKPDTIIDQAHYCSTGEALTSTLLPSICRKWNKTIVTREQYAEAFAAATPEVQNETKESYGVVKCKYPDLIGYSSIEQLSADYHDKAAEADRLQAVADEALKAADDALLALEKAGELIGLVISIDTKPKQPAQESQPEITDWYDLLVGDVIWIGESTAPFTAPSGEYHVVGLDAESETQPVSVEWGDGEVWPLLAERGWRFIRRP